MHSTKSFSAAPSFGRLTPLIAPRSVAILGASDREGNLGGVALGFLQKFGFAGPVWPVNPTRSEVGGVRCYPNLASLPEVPDLVILAVPASAVIEATRDCVAAGVPAAVVWAGGFAEQGPEGRELQRQLAEVARAGSLLLCGPNCVGVLNTSIGLTASFSSMLYEHASLARGAVSMVSQSGGIAVMAHSRAQRLGFGFRVTASVGNEAVLGIADFIRALAQDDGTRVIAVYTEGLSDPAAFVSALAEARERGKPVVVLKGGASEASGRAALAHTGRLAGADRSYEAIFREFAVIRVYSTEELLDVSLQLASLRPGQLPTGDRVLISTFGGGSGVVATDQCVREGLQVPAMDPQTQARVLPLLTPLSSAVNPIDLTPGLMTQPKYRAGMPAALRALGAAPDIDAWMFMAAGFGDLAPALVDMFDDLRSEIDKPICLTWQSMPEGTAEALASRGIFVFTEHARAARALGHLVRYAADLRSPPRTPDTGSSSFPWQRYVTADIDADAVMSEDVAARILEEAGLPVARGRLALTADEAERAAVEVGFPVAVKGISAAITHRAAAGLVALDLRSVEAVRRTEAAFRARASELGAELEGVWVQRMFSGDRELLVTALRDAEFGVLVGCGVGGGQTELVDDVVFARAPLQIEAAAELLDRMRTLRRMPEWLSPWQRNAAAEFVARFSALVATAPWERFTFEVNPVKIGANEIAAVDGLLIIG